MKKPKEKGQWFYSRIVKEHFFKPRNFMDFRKAEKYKADGIGEVGNVMCGDVMKVWIKVDKEKDRIKDMKWETYGCASAIAATSMLSVMVTEKGGMKLDDAMKITPMEIANRLGGLPEIKFHCSVLGDDALRTAIDDYFRKSGQEKRIRK